MSGPIYRDLDGYIVSLDTLCDLEPAWAANRIRAELAIKADLLAACESALAFMGKMYGEAFSAGGRVIQTLRDDLRAAIAKAKGGDA